ncbi:MAG: 3-deoxy-manno-octulosonate cytidylyltransferase, partial [Leptospiraceae bacterium]|nr:3-deoxy-manno-octulosonate cytidylyltransferase [Leptospiraceae bacterium]
MANIVGIIPARYGSTRFPGKPLLKIGNKSMIRWTYENTKKSSLLSEVYVATDDERIEKEILSFGGNVIMTSPEHASGTDRLIEATQKIPNNPDIIVNIQGDEPGIDPELINGVIQKKLDHRNWEMSTACVLITDKNELNDPNRVKVVFDKNGKALYFSRSLIPSLFKKEIPVYRHLGIYSYERKFLLSYNSLPQSPMEESES